MAQVNNTSKVKVSQAFRDAIESFVITKMDSNPFFAKKVCNPNKNIDDCLTYILNTVKNSGIQGFADDEIFSMAVHYYEEENLEIGKPINCKIVVNHHVELTPEEIEELKQKARDDVYNKERTRLTTTGSIKKHTAKPAVTATESSEETLTLF